MVRPEEVVVCDPQGEIEISIFETVVAAGVTVRSLEGAVEPLDQLLERPEFFGDLIVIGETDDLRDVEAEVLTEFLSKQHGGERIGAVAIGNKPEAVRELLREASQSLSHGEDAGADTAVVRTEVAKDGALYSIHDEPDVAFLAADLDVGLIADKLTGRLVIVVIDERLDQYGGGLAVLSDLLVRDLDAVYIP